jgi:hypothetical protein
MPRRDTAMIDEQRKTALFTLRRVYDRAVADNQHELDAIDAALDEGLDEKARHDWRVEYLRTCAFCGQRIIGRGERIVGGYVCDGSLESSRACYGNQMDAAYEEGR